MRTILATMVAIGVATGTAAYAKDQSDQQGACQLKKALAAVAATAQGPPPPEHFKAKADNDQGDDNASPTAILKVCSKDTPAAHRAAICPVGVSPE